MRSLFRPSALAHAWGIHPRTVVLWIKNGELAAIRTPKGQYRIPLADAEAFRKLRGLLLPQNPSELCIFGKKSELPTGTAALLKGVRTKSHRHVYDTLAYVVASPPKLILIDARTPDAEPLLHALRSVLPTAKIPAWVFDATQQLRCEKLKRAGASRTFLRKTPELFVAELAAFLTPPRKG
jgi:hypothetical protein